MPKRVILLSGHNYMSPGCVNKKISDKPITEFSIATYVACKVFEMITDTDVDLVLKARNDYGNLVDEVNSLNGDLLISMHFNAHDGNAQGTEVLHSISSINSKICANNAQKILVKHLGLRDRGAKGVSTSGRGGTILNKTKPVALLFEPFFLDEVEDEETLKEYVKNTVMATVEFIRAYVKNA